MLAVNLQILGVYYCTLAQIAQKIVGGSPVISSKYPWIVSLQSNGAHYCGGTLITNDTILTAAHCSINLDVSTIEVFAHRNNLHLNPSVEHALKFGVISIAIHPEFSNLTYQNDIAVWKIKLSEGDANLIPSGIVKLDDGKVGRDNISLWIAGWGALSSGGQGSGSMLEAKVKVVNTKDCQAQNHNLVTPDKICATTKGHDTCQGDSGGPMFWSSGNYIVLVGITSAGEGRCGQGIPSPYSRISYQLKWLSSQI